MCSIVKVIATGKKTQSIASLQTHLLATLPCYTTNYKTIAVTKVIVMSELPSLDYREREFEGSERSSEG